MGGPSAERDVSLATGQNIFESIDKHRYQPIKIDWQADNTFDVYEVNNFSTIKKTYHTINALFLNETFDIVFLALHGKTGEDGVIQGYLETSNIPYTGSNLKSSLLGMDKYLSKLLLDQSELTTPKFVYRDQFKSNKLFKQEIKDVIGFPCILKPNASGSSIGLSKVNSPNELDHAIAVAEALDTDLIVEEYIKGTELSISVLETDEVIALPICEIVPPGDVFDYESKYDMSRTQEIIPARIDENLERKAKQIAIKAHQLFSCRGYSRLDVLVKDGEIYVLEINTLPGFTKESLFPKMANYQGITNAELIDYVIQATLNEV
jgi:D-alanine-D-alanine ligase